MKYAMKHPALARVFSVALAILGLFLLINGARGFGKNAKENDERLYEENKLSGRIESFVALREEMDGTSDIDATLEALKTFVTEHDKAAADHKMDTAIYSATKGGLNMGETLIVNARAEMEEIQRQLKDTEGRKAFLEGLLTELIASNRSRLPWLDALAAEAAGCAVDSYTESVKITLATEKLRALMENEPQPADFSAAVYTPPEAPGPLTLPGLPDLSGASREGLQAAYDAAAAQYMSAAAAWEQANAQYAQDLQAYYDGMAQQEWDRLHDLQEQLAGEMSEAAMSAEYRLAHRAWEKECESTKRELQFDVPKAQLRRLAGALEGMSRRLRALPADWLSEYGDFLGGLDELISLCDGCARRLDTLSRADLSTLSNAEFLQRADEVRELFDMLCDAFSCIASNIDNPAHLITELLDKLRVTELLSGLLEGMLQKAEQQMQAALEELWYQMGETEKDRLKLEAEKLGLDKEAALLSRRTLEADALKDLRSRYTTARQLLANVPEIREGLGPDGDPEQSARAFLKSYGERTQKLYHGRQLVCLLELAGGLLALLAVPTAYELIRSRTLLIVPPIACALCAAAAEGVHLMLGLKQNYLAIFTAIFALVHFAIVLPKKKAKS